MNFGVPRFVIIGNPGNRRVGMFQEALARQGQDAPIVLPWIDLARGPEAIDEALTALGTEPFLVRIDSFGEDFEVERQFLRRGFAAAAACAEDGVWVATPEEI